MSRNNRPRRSSKTPFTCAETLAAIEETTDLELESCPYPAGSPAKIEWLRVRMSRTSVLASEAATDDNDAILHTAADNLAIIPPADYAKKKGDSHRLRTVKLNLPEQ